jgi:hypothetical protein
MASGLNSIEKIVTFFRQVTIVLIEQSPKLRRFHLLIAKYHGVKTMYKSVNLHAVQKPLTKIETRLIFRDCYSHHRPIHSYSEIMASDMDSLPNL